MRALRYTKYEATLDDLDPHDLMQMMQQQLMQSGFEDNPFEPDPDAGQTMLDLYQAILEALYENDMIPEGMLEKAIEADDWLESELGELVKRQARNLEQAGLIRLEGSEADGASGTGEEADPTASRFSLTGRASDLLGYNSLRDMLGGREANLGQHDSRRQTAGVESAGESRPWSFGDPLNLDLTETFKHAMLRSGGATALEEDDLHVQQTDLQVAATTVVLLDCSHSMILYGEDRFTPAKQVALALAHLIRSQYRGDAVRFVLFHDDAEEIPHARLAHARVGPYHTNTAQGLKIARRLIKQEGNPIKQIVMITDGKPTAITLPNGRVYKNAYGADPAVMGETLREVGACRREGIQINTFMLARDPELIAFVQRMTRMTQGRAYFTNPHNIGQYVLQDFAERRIKRVN